MAHETVELFLQYFIVQQFGVGGLIGAGFGLHAADPAQLPGGCEYFVIEDALEGAAGFQIEFQLIGGDVEIGLVFGADDDVLGSAQVAGCPIAGSPGSWLTRKTLPSLT